MVNLFFHIEPPTTTFASHILIGFDDVLIGFCYHINQFQIVGHSHLAITHPQGLCCSYIFHMICGQDTRTHTESVHYLAYIFLAWFEMRPNKKDF